MLFISYLGQTLLIFACSLPPSLLFKCQQEFPLLPLYGELTVTFTFIFVLSLSLSPHHAFHLISGPGCQASDFWVEICQECSLQEEIRNLLFQSISSGKPTLFFSLLCLTALSACWRKPHKSNQGKQVFGLFALVFGLLLLSLVNWNLGQFAEESRRRRIPSNSSLKCLSIVLHSDKPPN